MESKLDWNDVAALERAISKKYGEEATINPKSLWDEEKENNYREQVKRFSKRLQKSQKQKQFSVEEINQETTLITVDKRSCPYCGSYSFSSRDDFFMSRFGCCHKCYIQYIEGREERWASGWRPNKEN